MSFGTILIIIFMVMFWMFRAIVALCTQFSIDFIGIVSYNLTFEIIISFRNHIFVSLYPLDWIFFKKNIILFLYIKMQRIVEL